MGSYVLSSRWVLMVSLPFEDAVGSLCYCIDRTFIQEVLYLSITKTHKRVYFLQLVTNKLFFLFHLYLVSCAKFCVFEQILCSSGVRLNLQKTTVE